jgi:hypothetical protein
MSKPYFNTPFVFSFDGVAPAALPALSALAAMGTKKRAAADPLADVADVL